MTHPNSLSLEAFACGEQRDTVADHLRECGVCTAFVERLRGALSAGPSRARAEAAVAKVAARTTPRPAENAARRRWFATASVLAVPLAAAAVLLLLVRTPGTRETSPTILPPTVVAPSDPSPETTFKGGVQVAVVRERGGQQARFTGKVTVRPGDRLRVEVALDREQAILAALMGDDASWLELMSGETRRPGTHFSDRSARVDASPMNATLLVGTPEAVARARTMRLPEGVTAIRVEWEAP